MTDHRRPHRNRAVTRRAVLATSGKFVASATMLAGLSPFAARAAQPAIEKDTLTFGFIKLTDMAPLAIAKELGYFEDEGLYVSLQPQANWKVLLDGVISGSLDGAHMLPGQPLGATLGVGTKAHIITPFSMDLNGNGITVANAIWAEMKKHVPLGADGKPVHPIKGDALKPVVDTYKADGKPFNMGMVFPLSSHNYELRYWLAAGGIHPGFYSPTDTSGQILADVLLSVTPPPQMPATLEAGTILGYCVGEPWNEQAVFKKIGVAIIADYEIWKNKPEKVFGMTADFAAKNPNTVIAITKALIRAGMWLDADNNANRMAAVKILSRADYVGADADIIAHSMTGTFQYAPGDQRPAPDFNVFFRYFSTQPFYSHAIWYLTQMRRWGQIATVQPDSWYDATAKSVYRPDIYLTAAKLLVAEGKAKQSDFLWDSDGYRPPNSDFIDGITFDARKPNDYLTKMKIGLRSDQRVDGEKVTQ